MRLALSTQWAMRRTLSSLSENSESLQGTAFRRALRRIKRSRLQPPAFAASRIHSAFRMPRRACGRVAKMHRKFHKLKLAPPSLHSPQ
jgi:hypothetical protein